MNLTPIRRFCPAGRPDRSAKPSDCRPTDRRTVRALRPALSLLAAALVGLGAGACERSTPPAAPIPSSVDLRGAFQGYGLPPRAQGHRGTCSIFTTCGAIEFALARGSGTGARMSPEYLNWAAGQAAGRPSDGNFFHNALNGFAAHGICGEAAMPYRERFDANGTPTPEARAEAAAVHRLAERGLAVHWIVPWVPDRFGVDEAQFAEIKSVLARGDPVAAGSGHSRLLVGYRDDPAAPGGGMFLTLDSGLGRFDEVTYDFVRRQVADVFWVEAR